MIGHESTCGDPIILSTNVPFPVYTAMHGQGLWDPTLVAPSLEAFWKCLELLRNFGKGRDNPVELQQNPPDDEAMEQYDSGIRALCEGDEEAVGFWMLLVRDVFEEFS